MNIRKILTREMAFRKLNLALSFTAVAVAAASLVAAMTVLNVHEKKSTRILVEKEAETAERIRVLEDEMRKATLKLSFNLVILPEDQNLTEWYTNDFAAKTMPYEYVDRLADSGIVLVRHFLPSLQQRIDWPEKNQSIILVGTRGEVPNLHKNPRKPLVQPVKAGEIVLGYELHRRFDLTPGDTVMLKGRRFNVAKCYSQRGNRDDITGWVPLQAAQDILGKPGQINAILALECLCAGANVLPEIKKKISEILPGTQVFEQGTRVVARAETRMKQKREDLAALEAEKEHRLELGKERERFATVVTIALMAICGAWVGILTFNNASERRVEIATFRTLGIRSAQILFLFLFKAVLIGIIGGLAGLAAGTIIGGNIGSILENTEALAAAREVVTPRLVAQVLAAAVALSVFASWLPAFSAAGKHPADVLRKE